MTAQKIIETTLPYISGMKVTKEEDYDTLLTYLNFAKSRLARDTLLWIGGTSITLTEENTYTLPVIPIQITEVYDESFNVRPRNSFDFLGYTQTGPNEIFINNPSVGTKLNINWYEEPADFELADEVVLSNDLIEALQHYICYKVFTVYKSEAEELKKKLHLDEYKKIIEEYKTNSDISDINSIGNNDIILQKGLI